MRKKGLIALGLAAVMTASALTGCGGASDKKESSSKKEAKGTVYYLNFKPEADAQWQELADIYTEKTGVKVNVVTAAANQYETTLKSEMGKSEAPTLFQVNGPVGLASWKDYCYDLKDSEIAKQITSDDFLLKDGDSVAGIGYAIESYGIIYNKNLLKKAGYTQDDIKNFDDLKDVFKLMVGEMLENGLEGELDDELGYTKYDYRNKDGENSRNGYSKKTLKTSFGETEIKVPRDRDGEFEPQLVKKNQTTLTGDIEEKILSMYAKGMTTSDIEAHIQDIYGLECSDSTISRITDKILPVVREWQSRPLEEIYAVVFMDAIHFQVRL